MTCSATVEALGPLQLHSRGLVQLLHWPQPRGARPPPEPGWPTSGPRLGGEVKVRHIDLSHKTVTIGRLTSRIAPRDAGRAVVFAPPRGHLGEEQHSDPGRGARSAIIFATWGDLEHYVHDYLSAIPTCQIRAARLGIVSGWACGDRRSVKNSPT